MYITARPLKIFSSWGCSACVSTAGPRNANHASAISLRVEHFLDMICKRTPNESTEPLVGFVVTEK